MKNFLDNLLSEEPQSESATILMDAIEVAGEEDLVRLALSIAPISLLGIGFQIGLELGRDNPKSALKILDMATTNEDRMVREWEEAPGMSSPSPSEKIAFEIHRTMGRIG